jgi:hypothetical protein
MAMFDVTRPRLFPGRVANTERAGQLVSEQLDVLNLGWRLTPSRKRM